MIIQPSSLLDYCYPVGSIYTSTNSTPPAELFGGVWKQIKDTFLLTAGDTYTAGNTGGSATVTPSGTVGGHTLTVAEMPSHNHTVRVAGGASGGNAFITMFGGWGNQINASWGNEGVHPSGTLTIKETTAGTNTATVNSGNEGGGGSHNHGFTGTSHTNMPPYKVVYAWERTA